MDSSDEEDFEFLPGGDNCADFLWKFKPVVLYLWQRAEETDFLKEVCQKISEDMCLDGEAVASVARSPTDKKARTKKEKESDVRKEDEMRSEFMKAFKATGGSVNSVAIVFLRKELLDARLQKKRMDAAGELDDETSGWINAHITALTGQLHQEEQKSKGSRAKPRGSLKRKRDEDKEPIDLCESTIEEEAEN